MFDFKLNQLPNNAKEAKIVRIRKQVGDLVKQGDVILELEGQKVNMPVKSEKTGVLTKLNVKEGDLVKLGMSLATLEEHDRSPNKNKTIEEIKLASLATAKIIKIRKQIGEQIKRGEALFEAEGNKGSMPIKATTQGILQELLVNEGDTVQKGDTLALIICDNNNQERPSSQLNVGNYNILINPQKKRTIASDIVIIGGGPGGYVAAIQAAKLGAKVILVEKEKVGGTCLNWGCIPTKALVRSAEVFNNLKNAKRFGCYAENIKLNMEQVIERKNSIVANLVAGIHHLLKKNGVELLSGVGVLKDTKTVNVINGNEEVLVNAEHIIIATGSQTANLPVPCSERGNLIFSKQALNLKALPQKITIIGGGVIGMEFAFIFKSFGVDVVVIEYMKNVLSMLDEDICHEITASAKEQGIKIYTNSKVTEIIKSEDTGCIVKFEIDNQSKYMATDKILISVGRKPYLEGLGVEAVGIELNDNKQGIKVNEKMQTNIPNVYAIGDVTNKMQLAHVASHQGIVAVKNIMGQDTVMDYSCVPNAIFTMPEIAAVGLSEKEAIEQNLNIKVGKFPFEANGKALTLGESKGFVKIITDQQTEKIIGAAIIGPHATDLIAELALAIKNNLTAEQLIETIHAHPTTAEAIHEATMEVEGGALHFAH